MIDSGFLVLTITPCARPWPAGAVCEITAARL